MNRTLKLYAIIFVALVAVLAIMQLTRKEVTDWRKNYELNSKTPFGLYIFNKESSSIFKNKITKISETPFEYYRANPKKKAHNILIIEQSLDQSSWRKIVQEAKKGADVMIFQEHLYGFVLDTLKIGSPANVNFEESNTVKLTDLKFKNDSIVIDKLPGRSGFYGVGKEVEILGLNNSSSKKIGANFIRRKVGKGAIYIHTEPLVLTNYYLLEKQNYRYTQDVLSYLPDRETIWFNEKADVTSSSEMRYILSQPALRNAWWLFLAGMILFIFFTAKRKQRIIPTIEPLQNKSVDFVKSIGNLYLQEGDFHDMMAKKAQYFLHKVRLELLLDTSQLNDDFVRKLNLKTGVSIDKITEAVGLMKKAIDPYSSVMKEDLERMNSLLDEIYK